MIGIGLVSGRHKKEKKGDELGVCVKKPLYKDFTSNSSRIQSYQSGWARTSPRPAVLADAGFYFTGTADIVQCYYCGLKLRRWDVYDDPWIEHARHGKDCPHILNVKGPQFYKEVANDIEQDGLSIMKRSLYTEDLIFTTAAQALMSMRCYSVQQIKDAMKEFVNSKGSLDFTAEDIALILYKSSIS